MKRELLKVVLEDLKYLSTEWNQDIDDASLRRASTVLRRLLVDQELLQAARMLGKDISVMAPLICREESFENLDEIVFYQAGGANFRGMEIQTLTIVRGVLSNEEIKQRWERERNLVGKSYPVKLSKFLKQTSFIVFGIKINREEVIKYITNKLGGAHYNSSRKTSNDGSTVMLEDKYVLMDRVGRELRVADKNAIYYELLSIGQRVVNSPDVKALLQMRAGMK